MNEFEILVLGFGWCPLHTSVVELSQADLEKIRESPDGKVCP